MKILKEKLLHSKFGLFKKIGESLLTPLEIEKFKMEKKVEKLLNSNLINLVIEYYLSGYIFTEKQNKIFLKQIDSLDTIQKLQFLDNKIVKGFFIDDVELLKFFPQFIEKKLHYKENREDGTIRTLDAQITKLYKKKLKTKDFQLYVFDNIVNTLDKLSEDGYIISKKNNNMLKSILQILDGYGIPIFKNLNIEQVIDFTDQIKKLKHTQKHEKTKDSNFEIMSDKQKFDDIISKFENKIPFLTEEIYEKDIESTKKMIGIIYAENHFNHLIAEESINLNSKNNIKDLPKEAVILLENMKDNYFIINKNRENLNEEIKFTIENIWGKRVPEVINKYLRVDEEYRLTMKNVNNKNAQQLMIESLENMDEILNNVKYDINTENLRDLSITHRYTKKLK